jgi:hypothetical protein
VEVEEKKEKAEKKTKQDGEQIDHRPKQRMEWQMKSPALAMALPQSHSQLALAL